MHVFKFSVEAKLWPRGCAVAERLWADPQDTTWKDAEQRLLEHRHRLVHARGLYADAIMPEYCRQNDGDCYTLKKQAISFEDQLNQRAFINEPFTLQPPKDTGSSYFDLPSSLFSIKSFLLICFLAILILRRRFISATITNCFRSVKFIQIH